MSKERNDNPILMQMLKPSINFPSLKARLRFNEFKKEFSKSKYNNFFKKCNNLNAVTSSMSNKYSMSDLYRFEKGNSEKIKIELNNLNNELKMFKNKFKKNHMKYKLKLSNDLKTDENAQYNNLIESVKENISQYLSDLHYSKNEKKPNKRVIFNNLKINIHPYLRNNIRTKSVSLKSLNYVKSLKSVSNISTDKSRNNNNIPKKTRIKKVASIDNNLNPIKSKMSLFSNFIDNKQNNNNNNNKDNIITFKKKFPFLRQNSYSFMSMAKIGKRSFNKDFINNDNNDVNDKNDNNDNEDKSNKDRYIINLPNI
jgi:hypothetical protein